MVVECYKVEMKIFNAIFFEYALALDELAQIQVIEETCLRQGKELSFVIQSATVSLNADHAWLAHVEALLVSSSKTVS